MPGFGPMTDIEKARVTVSEGYSSCDDSADDMERQVADDKRRPRTKPKARQADDVLAAQSALLLEKIELLEMKLNRMEANLQTERQCRQKLEGDVQLLQAENVQLKDSRAKAGEQLQSFMNVVYKEFDVTPVKVGSQESLLDNRSHRSFASGTRSRTSRQSIRSNSSCSSMSSVASSNIL